MSGTERNYLISKVVGDVLLHHGAFGWVRAEEGLEFPECMRVTIKTAANSRVKIVNSRGITFEIPPKSLRLVDGLFSEDDVETLRFIKVSARDMKAARRSMKLAPAI
jgi:hypothetical protein